MQHSGYPQPVNKIWNKNFICVLLATSLLNLANSSVNTLITTFAAFLGAGAVLVGALSGLFYAVAFSMRPISGPVTTKLDKRGLMIFANILGVIVNAGYAISGNIGLFIAFRVLNGIQFSIIGSLAMTVASDSLPPEKLASGLGFYGVGGAVTMAIGPAIGIALKELGTQLGGQALGFRYVFLFSAASMLMTLIPTFLIRLPKRSKAELANTGAWYKNIIATNAIPPAAVMMLLCMGYGSYSAYIYPFANSLGIAGIGSFFTVFALTVIATRPFCGKLIDKHGVFRFILLGAALFGVSFVLVGLSHSLLAILMSAAVGAIGYSAAQPAVQAMCIQAVTPVRRSVAANTTYFGMDLGYFLGPLIGGVLFSSFGKYSTMYIAMAVPVILSMVVLVITWQRYERNRAKVEVETAAASQHSLKKQSAAEV